MRSRQVLIEEQEKLLRLYREAEWRLMKLPGVVGVGVGAKEVGGRITEEFAFRVYVDRKKHRSELPPDTIVPSEIKGVKTDVIVKSEDTMLADDSKYRPIKGGIQIRNEYFSGDNTRMVGTLGCLAELDNVTRDVVALGCQHVLLAGQASLQVKVGQPRYVVSCCCCTFNEIGKVLTETKNSDVDCAIISLDEDILEEIQNNNTLNVVEGIGTLTGVAQAVCFEPVKKRGRTTELTTGIVVDVLYESSQILVHPTGTSPKFADFGDSGSVIVNDSNQVIGLLWATDRSTKTKGVANHIGPVMQAMGIRIAGVTGSGLGIPATPCSSSGIPGSSSSSAVLSSSSSSGS